jgi:NADPH:quinone reductase-like Zn-dependent oxidoreductase
MRSSDFAGEVFNVGPKVTRFVRGDRVAGCVHQTHVAGVLTEKDAAQALGALLDGGLREYGISPFGKVPHCRVLP